MIRILSLSLLALGVLHFDAFSQSTPTTKTGLAQTPAPTSLEQLSASLQSIAKQVEPAVVQIFNSSFTLDRGGEVALQQRGSGSGIIVSADGYIVTNAHVVEGARQLQVRLNRAASGVGGRLVSAKLIGKDRQTDVAVIKVDRTALPFLNFADSDSLSQVVGMNTLILSKSGGSEGVGFAIPSNLVDAICRQIRVDHHVHHHQIGISVRAITPAIVQGLKLPVEDGILVDDVTPRSTAEGAGMKVGDVITKVRGQSIHNVRQFGVNMYSYAVGDSAQIEALRGERTLSFSVPVVERTDDPQRFEELVTEQNNAIPRLGILALTIDEKVSGLLPPLRNLAGVLVAAKAPLGGAFHFGDELAAGDVIYALNGVEIKDVPGLKNVSTP